MKPEPIVVETRPDAEGHPRPIAFNFRQQRIGIESYGRRWSTDTADHFLVMDHRLQVYELAYQRGSGAWLMLRAPSPSSPGRAAI